MSSDVLTESNYLLDAFAFDDSTKLTHKPIDTAVNYADDLQTIDKWDEINNGHHSEKRLIERFKYRTCVRLAFICQNALSKTRRPQLVVINAFSKDISTHGAGVLCPERIFPLKWHDGAETLLIKPFLSISDSVALGLQRAEGNWITINAEIRSLRKTRNGLNNIGLKFVARPRG